MARRAAVEARSGCEGKTCDRRRRRLVVREVSEVVAKGAEAARTDEALGIAAEAKEAKEEEEEEVVDLPSALARPGAGRAGMK